MTESVTVGREYVRWLREQRAAWIAQGLNWKGEPIVTATPTDTEETQP